MNGLAKSAFACLVLALGLLSPIRLLASDAVARYAYEDGGVYSVRTGLGIATTIELDPSDNVLDYSVGFNGGWDVVRRGNVFYVKPRNVDVDTNLLVRTARRNYIIELQVVATDWRKLDEARRRGVQYRIVFEYPKDEEAPVTPAEEVTQVSSAIEPRRAYHYDYEVSTRTRRDWLRPSAVYDDGQFTYIRLPNPDNIPSGNWPSVFARHARHEEDFVVNSSIEENTIVVHGIYPFLVIRHGNEVVGLRRNFSE
jgi:type IV secretion system protein VirB9